MIFDKTRVMDSPDSSSSASSSSSTGESAHPSFQSREREKPLTCMIYFFASQMPRNLHESSKTASTTSFPPRSPLGLTHRLDSLLANLRKHALFYPNLVTKFDLLPVAIPSFPGYTQLYPKETMHDTLLLVDFKSVQAREAFMATRGWAEFMEKTEKEGVFRRVPHVRCTRSLKGLRDPIEILSIEPAIQGR